MSRKVDLAALAAADVPDSTPSASRASAGVTELPIDRVVANPLNKRTEADEDQAELEAMAQTIREHGVLQPLIVVTAATFSTAYPEQREAVGEARWVTLIGNRRLVAAKMAGQSNVPGIINNGQAASMFEVMLVENGHRRDLAPLREAEAMRLVLDRDNLKQSDLSRRIGRTEAYVTQRLHLLGLIPALRDALDAGTLTVERGREIGAKLSAAEQEGLAAAGPPYVHSLNGVKARTQRATIAAGDPAAAAQSIRKLYTGEQLAELVRLLNEGVGR